MKTLIAASLLLLPPLASAAPVLPPEVQSFIAERDTCDHFRSEPWDPGNEPGIRARREFIFRNLGKFCSGTDQKLAALRKTYRANPSVIDALRDYEAGIESR